jgi:hypothetical protein
MFKVPLLIRKMNSSNTVVIETIYLNTSLIADMLRLPQQDQAYRFLRYNTRGGTIQFYVQVTEISDEAIKS